MMGMMTQENIFLKIFSVYFIVIPRQDLEENQKGKILQNETLVSEITVNEKKQLYLKL